MDTPIKWPNNAKSSVMITVDVDAEFVWLNMDPNVANLPKTLSMGQYGPRRGLERILDVLDRFNIKATFFVPGRVAEIYPEQILGILKRGHEIGHHGYEHENFGVLDKEKQKEIFIKGTEALERILGVRPAGFRTPAGDMTADTPRLLQELGFSYSSSMRGDDRPYFVELDGKPTDLVEIPAHWELDDFPYFAFNFFPAFPKGQGRIANYNQVFSIWKDEFDGYYKYGLNYVIMFHPQTIGTPGRIEILERLLTHMTTKGDVWFCTGSEMTDFWRQYGRTNDDKR